MKGIRITLVAARINANLTQAEAAKRLKVSNVTIHNWERGKASPSIVHMSALSKLYRIPIDNIILPKRTT